MLGFYIVSPSKKILAWVYKDFVAIYNGQASDGNVGVIKQVGEEIFSRQKKSVFYFPLSGEMN